MFASIRRLHLQANIKCELLHDWRSANNTRRTAALEDEAILADEPDADAPTFPNEGSMVRDTPGHVPESPSPAQAILTADLDAEFERLVGSPS